MGLFLALAGVIDASESEVAAALADYTNTKNGSFQAETRSTEDDDTLVVHGDNGNTCLLFPSNFFDWDDVSKALSLFLKKAVFSLHIHDGDLWMYVLYRDGIQVDGFNPIPDYWDEEISDEERASFKGNAAIVSQYVSSVRSEDIEKYLVVWDLDADEPGKAYAHDEYPYGLDWQMLDFMKKLRLPYPMDSRGHPLGQTFLFKVPSK